jgi:hypothetical protein
MSENNFFEGFEGRAICPNCGGMDAGIDQNGNVLSYCCGYFTAEEIKEFRGE